MIVLALINQLYFRYPYKNKKIWADFQISVKKDVHVMVKETASLNKTVMTSLRLGVK